MSSRILPLLVLSLFLAACAATLTPGGEQVQITTEPPAATCSVLGQVEAAAADEQARIELRNKAAEMGADVVVLTTTTGSRMSGRAFSCKPGQL